MHLAQGDFAHLDESFLLQPLVRAGDVEGGLADHRRLRTHALSEFVLRNVEIDLAPEVRPAESQRDTPHRAGHGLKDLDLWGRVWSL